MKILYLLASILSFKVDAMMADDMACAISLHSTSTTAADTDVAILPSVYAPIQEFIRGRECIFFALPRTCCRITLAALYPPVNMAQVHVASVVKLLMR